MKLRKTVLLVGLLGMAIGSVAQEQIVILGDNEGRAVSHDEIPAEFAFDGKPRMVLYDHSNGEPTMIILDEDFRRTKTCKIVSNEKYESSYTECYRQESDYRIVEKARKEEEITKIINRPDTLTPPFTEEQAERYVKGHSGNYTKTTTDEGIIFITRYFSYTHWYENNTYENVETTEPTEYYCLKADGRFYDVYRSLEAKPVYQGAWVEYPGQSTYSEGPIFIPIDYLDFDTSAGSTGRLNLSQTLFNTDEKIEYLLPLLKSCTYKMYEEDRDGDGETDHYFREQDVAVCGFKVVNEDGQVVQTVRFDVSFMIFATLKVLKMNGKHYLMFSGTLETADDRDEHQRGLLLYEIDRTTNSIRQVVRHVGMSVSPAVADRRDVINVELDDPAKAPGLVEVVDAAGRIVKRIPIERGQQRLSFCADRLGRGVNVVRMTGCQGAKLIVR